MQITLLPDFWGGGGRASLAVSYVASSVRLALAK